MMRSSEMRGMESRSRFFPPSSPALKSQSKVVKEGRRSRPPWEATSRNQTTRSRRCERTSNTAVTAAAAAAVTACCLVTAASVVTPAESFEVAPSLDGTPCSSSRSRRILTTRAKRPLYSAVTTKTSDNNDEKNAGASRELSPPENTPPAPFPFVREDSNRTTGLPSSKKSKSSKATVSKSGPAQQRTTSFGAVWSGTLLEDLTKASSVPSEELVVEPHTLILGTHPSRESFARQQYYAFPTNAFWWIAGDCLGFRRSLGLSKTGKPYGFCSSLRYGPDHVIPYEQQLRTLCSFGFALWDICQSCERPNSSLDQDIVREVVNPIRDFCEAHPTIRRIVLSNGGIASQIFCRHFQDWFVSGELDANADERSQRAFARSLTKNKAAGGMPGSGGRKRRTITVVSALGVSGAAASYTYEEKREFWETNVYRPGLELFHASAQETKDRPE